MDVLGATRREQHFYCPNRHFQGILEAERGCTDELVIATGNEKMGLKPTVAQLERSQHLGPKIAPGNAQPLCVFGARQSGTRCTGYAPNNKQHNLANKDEAIFINQYLTAKRGGLAYRTKLLKHNKTMADCWAYSGRVLIKNPQWRDGVIKEIHTTKDLDNVNRDMPQLDFLVCYTRM